MDPEVLVLASYACAFHRGADTSVSVGLLHDAVQHMPMTADMISVAGFTFVILGDAGKAFDLFSRGVRLTKDDASVSLMKAGVGASLFFLGRIEEALEYLEEAQSGNPLFPLPPRYLAACHYELGNIAESKRSAARAFELNPEKSLAAIRPNIKSFRHPRMSVYLAALEAADLLE